jgi:GT2 family glycosyltransferase
MDFKRLGYEIHFCADTEIIHLMGGSMGDKNIMMTRNFKLFMERNYNFIHRGIINFLKS